MSDPLDWNAPPLSQDDEKLVEEYRRAGRSLDDLPYSPEFDTLARNMGIDPSDQTGMHSIFKKLLNLRKQARLPRLYSISA